MNHQIRRYPISERSTSLASCPPVATELNTWGQTLHLKIDIFSGQKYVYLHSLICFICWLGSWITFHGTASDSCTDPGDLRVFGAGSKMLNRYLKSNIKIVFESKLKRLKCQFLLNPSLIRKKPRKPILLTVLCPALCRVLQFDKHQERNSQTKKKSMFPEFQRHFGCTWRASQIICPKKLDDAVPCFGVVYSCEHLAIRHCGSYDLFVLKLQSTSSSLAISQDLGPRNIMNWPRFPHIGNIPWVRISSKIALAVPNLQVLLVKVGKIHSIYIYTYMYYIFYCW